jgi:hypothetical protein
VLRRVRGRQTEAAAPLEETGRRQEQIESSRRGITSLECEKVPEMQRKAAHPHQELRLRIQVLRHLKNGAAGTLFPHFSDAKFIERWVALPAASPRKR